MSHYTFQWRTVLNSLPDLLWGALVTLEIAVISMILGTLLGILLALVKRSGSKALTVLPTIWIEIARNTPALFQVYMVYFGLGSLGLRLDSYASLLVAITFVNAGFLAEIFRGGFEAVQETQMRAARSLGMGAGKAMWHVILPQMLRAVFYSMTNQMVWSVLMTSLGIVVGLTTDLMGVTQSLNNKTFRTFEYFLAAAIIYYLLTKFLIMLSRLAAWRLFRY